VAQTLQEVETGPQYTPLRYGLLSAARSVPDANGHWQNGTLIRVDPCEPAAVVTGAGCTTAVHTKVPTGTIGWSAAQPFQVYGAVQCSPVGWGDDVAELERLATQHLTNGEGRAVEHAFWTGQAQDGGVIYPHLAADDEVLLDDMTPVAELQSAAVVVSGGPVGVMEGIQLLEGALAQCYGGEGFIHIPATAVARLSNVGVVREQGGQLRTLLGNTVVVYSSGDREGPDGSNPPAGQSWIYATGSVWYRRSPVKALGRRPGDFLARDKNTMFYVVERTYVVDWDCCHLAVLVEIPGAAT